MADEVQYQVLNRFVYIRGPDELQITRNLLRAGANPNILNVNYETPFHHAVRGSAEKTRVFLEDPRTDPTIVHEPGETPLETCIRHLQPEIFRLLMADDRIKLFDPTTTLNVSEIGIRAIRLMGQLYHDPRVPQEGKRRLDECFPLLLGRIKEQRGGMLLPFIFAGEATSQTDTDGRPVGPLDGLPEIPPIEVAEEPLGGDAGAGAGAVGRPADGSEDPGAPRD